MNWTCLVWGAPMLGVLIWWFVSARKWFKGPKVNVQHLMLGRDADVVGEEESKGQADADTLFPREKYEHE